MASMASLTGYRANPHHVGVVFASVCLYLPFFPHLRPPLPLLHQDEEDAEQTDVPEERSGEVTLNAESEEARADPGTEGGYCHSLKKT